MISTVSNLEGGSTDTTVSTTKWNLPAEGRWSTDSGRQQPQPSETRLQRVQVCFPTQSCKHWLSALYLYTGSTGLERCVDLHTDISVMKGHSVFILSPALRPRKPTSISSPSENLKSHVEKGVDSPLVRNYVLSHYQAYYYYYYYYCAYYYRHHHHHHNASRIAHLWRFICRHIIYNYVFSPTALQIVNLLFWTPSLKVRPSFTSLRKYTHTLPGLKQIMTCS